MSLGKRVHQPNHLKILYHTDDEISQVAKRWEDDSICNKQKGHEIVPEVRGTPILSKLTLVEI